jgi:quinol monooxygenase YgiN
MLINAITYEFKPESAGEAAALLEKLSTASLTEPGCHRFDVARAIDAPHIFVLYEVWESQAALDEHMTAPHFKEYGINGIRKLAVNRTAYLCHPLS